MHPAHFLRHSSVGLRTDQVKVYDNFVGIASTNGAAGAGDPHCVAEFGAAACKGFAANQRAPPTLSICPSASPLCFCAHSQSS